MNAGILCFAILATIVVGLTIYSYYDLWRRKTAK